MLNKELPCTIVSARQEWTLNGGDLVKVTVKSAVTLNLGIGDSISVFGRIYKMNRLPKITKTKTHLLQYECEYEGIQYDLLRVTYDLTVETTNNTLQDVSGDSFTGTLQAFMRILIANANRVFPGGWSLGVCPDTDVETRTFGESDNCLSVLQDLCDKHDVQFEIVHSGGKATINIKQVGQILPYTFQYGKGKGLYSLTRENVSSSNIITRLKVRGSADNITNKYRSDRLLLPGKSKSTSYIEDATAIAKYGVYEATKIFDVKPTFTGHVETVSSILEFVDTSVTFDLNAVDGQGQTIYLLPGVAAVIHFNSGNLAGYEFEIAKYDHATHKFKLKKYTDARGAVFPSETSTAFQFAAGDEYKILQIALPDALITAAENKLQEEAETYYNQNSQPRVKYSLSISKEYLEHLVGGSGTIVNVFTPGDYLPIKDDDIGVDKSIRIKSFERDLIEEYKYNLTISDTVTTAIINRVITELTEIDKIIKFNDLQDPARARANWRTSRELLDMVFDAEGDYYTEKIKPLSIDTQLLSVGAKSMQFGLTNTVFQPNYNGNANSMRWQGGVLTHYTIVDDGVRSWAMADGSATFTQNVAYYLYAKCPRAAGNTAGTFIFTTEQIKVEDDANYWHFLIGTVSSIDAGDGVRSLALTYGFTMVNGRFIKTGRIESADGDTYFDLDDGEIGGRIVFTSNGQQKTLEQLGAETLENKNYINNTLPGILSEIQAQLDGQIEQFFDTYDPTTSNAPASGWTTTADKENHLGDLFYNTDTGKVFRWVKENGVYKWQVLQDSEVAQALALANDALALAGTKRRIFTSTPYAPYDVGDLWVQGSTGDILRCKTSRTTGSYSASDWEKASKYTDNTDLINFINNVYEVKIEDLTTQIDGKIESWFQTSDPATAWTTDAVRAKHIGDTWFDAAKNSLKFYRYLDITALKALMTASTFHVWKRTSLITWTGTTRESHVGDFLYNTSTKKVFIYTKGQDDDGNDTYSWVEITDENARLLAEAWLVKLNTGAAVFKDTVPTVPYYHYDVYINGLDVYISGEQRSSSSSYYESDWSLLASKFYCWQQTSDQTAIDAYIAASKAQDTADGKRQVFVDTPKPPYDIGDLWVDGQVLRRSIATKKASQSYNVNDWVLAVYYDNTQTVIDGGIVTSGTIQVAGDNKSILAGITGQGTAATSIRFWAGASFENRATAPFRVSQSGQVTMKDADITGAIHATSGEIGGFTIASGRIGANGTSDSVNGLSIYDTAIHIRDNSEETKVYSVVGNSIPSVSGVKVAGRFEMVNNTDLGDGGTALLAKYLLSNTALTGEWDLWNRPLAFERLGNELAIGKLAQYDIGYIGQAYTGTLENHFKITHTFVFTSIGSSYLSMYLPSASLVNRELSNRVVTFSIRIVVVGSSNKISLLPPRRSLSDNTAVGSIFRAGSTPSNIDLDYRDAIELQYYMGNWYVVSQNWNY